MTASQRGTANRRRGAEAERSVVAYLRSAGWPDARRYLAGDGRQPGDIDWHPLICLEVKDIAPGRSSWPTWCRQAVAAARPGMIPAVVRRTRGMPDVALWEVRLRAVDWWSIAPPIATYSHLVDGCEWSGVIMRDLADAVRAVDA